MKLDAILHIPMSEYCHGLDEKYIVYRMRSTKGDLKRVTLYYGDTACRVTKTRSASSSCERPFCIRRRRIISFASIKHHLGAIVTQGASANKQPPVAAKSSLGKRKIPAAFAAGTVRLSVLDLLFFVLQGIQLVIAALPVEQILVVALFQNLSVGQQDDVVRVLDGT